jgi:aminoglycoside phosphotransferase (APT) family kinase protein
MAVLDLYNAANIQRSDPVLLHGDFGLHNLVFRSDFSVAGVFDYSDASLGDCHYDFRSLVLDVGEQELFKAACTAYQHETGRVIDQQCVFLYNAVLALSYLAYRAGTSPEAISCGRNLQQDLRWTRNSIARALDLR